MIYIGPTNKEDSYLSIIAAEKIVTWFKLLLGKFEKF